ncbi:MAG: SDR family NAD(P)-dependent oxidoreductase [Pseudomonadota bacterium]
MRLEGKTALITGSSSGIGAAVASAYADEGVAHIAINYPDDGEQARAETIVKTLQEAGAKAIAIKADVADASQVAAMVGQAQAFAGHLDILVNNAGIAHGEVVEDIPIDTWDRVIGVHLRGTFLTTQAALPQMYERGFGRIINTVSQLAYKGAPALAAYTAAKGGILSFTRSLALEIGARNVRANCVAPGATHTPILDGVPEESLAAVKAGIPIGHFAEVSDIAPAYVFLASRDGDHFQGQCISPNGGDCFL